MSLEKKLEGIIYIYILTVVEYLHPYAYIYISSDISISILSKGSILRSEDWNTYPDFSALRYQIH